MRECTVCNEKMKEGYYNEADHEYYCGDDCLNRKLTPFQVADLQEDEENMLLYWTEWENDDI